VSDREKIKLELTNSLPGMPYYAGVYDDFSQHDTLQGMTGAYDEVERGLDAKPSRDQDSPQLKHIVVFVTHGTTLPQPPSHK